MFFKSKKPVLSFSLQDQCLSLQGVVDAQTVAVFTKAWQLQNSASPTVLQQVNWSAVSESDSTGLALMLMLQGQQSEKLALVGLPSKLVTLLHLYDLEDVFEFSEKNQQQKD